MVALEAISNKFASRPDIGPEQQCSMFLFFCQCLLQKTIAERRSMDVVIYRQRSPLPTLPN